jgi:PTH1 family peptidyl-tRNA hydrolase
LKAIIGIGNPGRQYEGTRHNIGWICLDYFAAKLGAKVNKIKHRSLIGETNIKGEKLLLVKPQTFVNLTGEAMREIKRFYKLENEDFIVVHDDASMEAGKLKIRPKGSDGGHNGLKSIIFQLQSDVFPRVKIGVGAPPEGWDLVDWVLGKFTDSEIKTLSPVVERVAEILPYLIENGVEKTMNRYNGT